MMAITTITFLIRLAIQDEYYFNWNCSKPSSNHLIKPAIVVRQPLLVHAMTTVLLLRPAKAEALVARNPETNMTWEDQTIESTNKKVKERSKCFVALEWPIERYVKSFSTARNQRTRRKYR